MISLHPRLFRHRQWRRLAPALLLACAAGSQAARPSFDCDNPKLTGVEKTICGDDRLAALDARMALAYADASAQSVRWKLPLPAAGQQAWLRERAACGPKPDARACLAALYPRRIAELQATYALVRGHEPVDLTCGGEPVTLFFFDTTPRVAVLERAGVASTLFQETAAAGILYTGGGASYAEHQGERLLVTKAGVAALRCTGKR